MFKQLWKRLTCNHVYDKTHGYLEFAVHGSKCVNCGKVVR